MDEICDMSSLNGSQELLNMMGNLDVADRSNLESFNSLDEEKWENIITPTRSLSPISNSENDESLANQQCSPAAFDLSTTPNRPTPPPPFQRKKSSSTAAANNSYSPQKEEEEMISLEEIHSLIGIGDDCGQSIDGGGKDRRLETIFEGVFLETPPKKKPAASKSLKQRDSLLLQGIRRLEANKKVP